MNFPLSITGKKRFAFILNFKQNALDFKYSFHNCNWGLNMIHIRIKFIIDLYAYFKRIMLVSVIVLVIYTGLGK